MFMWGPAPIRRTVNYLTAGKFIAKGEFTDMAPSDMMDASLT